MSLKTADPLPVLVCCGSPHTRLSSHPVWCESNQTRHVIKLLTRWGFPLNQHESRSGSCTLLGGNDNLDIKFMKHCIDTTTQVRLDQATGVGCLGRLTLCFLLIKEGLTSDAGQPLAAHVRQDHIIVFVEIVCLCQMDNRSIANQCR